MGGIAVVTCCLYLLQNYESGSMLTGELKNELVSVLHKLVGEHQERRKAVTDEMVYQYMAIRPLNFKQ